ncbi:uncharacterized protein METZ01_LOCUS315841 [marine metagenome]|uniref:Uncharacterized protein n=1 Tax=marine metagenome TaxID=408172 RepID=A0A382NRJ6_9ZZZZ
MKIGDMVNYNEYKELADCGGETVNLRNAKNFS